MLAFGTIFKKTLRDRGLTQIQAADLLGTSQSVISYYCNLKSPPRHGTLLNLAERLGVNAAELSGETLAKGASTAQKLPDHQFEKLPVRALKNLKRRWKAKYSERDTIKHLVTALFPDDAKDVLAWLDQK